MGEKKTEDEANRPSRDDLLTEIKRVVSYYNSRLTETEFEFATEYNHQDFLDEFGDFESIPMQVVSALVSPTRKSSKTCNELREKFQKQMSHERRQAPNTTNTDATRTHCAVSASDHGRTLLKRWVLCYRLTPRFTV